MSTSEETASPAVAAEDPQETTNKQLMDTMEAVGSDEEALRKAFGILCSSNQMKDYVSADVIRGAMPNLCACVEDEEIDEIIKKAQVENDKLINVGEFIKIMRWTWKRLAELMMVKLVNDFDIGGLESAFEVLAKTHGSYVSLARLLRVIPFLGGNLDDEEIIGEIKKVKNNVEEGGQMINCEEFIRIIRNIWQKSIDLLLKAMGEDAKDALREAFGVLSNKLDESVSATILGVVMLNLGKNLTFAEVDWMIHYVEANQKDKLIKKEGLTEIMSYVKDLTEKYPLENIYGVLTSEKTRKVVLFGKSGVGKTWMATKIADRATREGKFHFALWVNLKGLNRSKIVAHQLSLLSASDQMETEEVEVVSEQDKEIKVVSEQDKKKYKLGQRIHEALENKRYLLIFDGVKCSEEVNAYLQEESQVLNKLFPLPPKDDKAKDDIPKDDKPKDDKPEVDKPKDDKAKEPKDDKPEVDKPKDDKAKDDKPKDDKPKYKVLITTSDDDKVKPEFKREAIGIEVKPWINDEATSFLENKLGDKFSQVKDLAEFYIKGSKGHLLPADILIIAKTLSYFVNSDQGLQKLQGVKEVVLNDAAHDYDGYHDIKKLFISTKVVPKIVLVDCYSFETPAEHFLYKRGGVHYNELISYWILEGHLGHFSCIDDAYAEGHRVLMELLDCGLLKTLKAGYVESSGVKFELWAQDFFNSQDFCNLYQNNRLGLATTFDNKLGNTVLGDGMIRTFPRDKEKEKKKEEEEEKMSTLLLDGDRTGEVPDNLFKSTKDLEILAIFNPTHKPFPLNISDMQKLRFLVLRGCEFLKSFDEVFKKNDPEAPAPAPEKLQKEARLQKSKSYSEPSRTKIFSDPNIIPKALSKLTVLEISGPSSLKEIPENLFDTMKNIKSLNMSSLQMEFLPASFYDLTTIEILILKDCSSLKRMESLKKFEKLQLLDLSGATSLEAFKDKSFSENGELKFINLSQSRIAKFPVVHSLKKLQYLSVSKCPALIRVRKIGSVKTLRVFDVSGSKNVEELLDPGLKNLENLYTLDVSGTAIRRLPSTIGTPRYLYISDCSNLKQLPPIETLSKVRHLDLSGSAILDDVKEDFITNLKCLVKFNLSKTSVVHLPSLSSLVNLRHLLLSQCRSLENLEGLGSLENLEVLDLSGCKAFSKIEDQSFDKLERLLSLDLSETPLENLPSLSNLKKLEKLNLRGCTKLRDIPGLEYLLSVLKYLNISKTTLKEPNIETLNPRSIFYGPKPSSSKIFDSKKILKDLGASSDNCDEKTMKLSQEEMDQCDYWSISNRLASHNSETIGEPVIDAHFLQLLQMYPTLLENSIKKFHFFIYPMEEETHPSIDEDLLRNEIVLRNIHLENFSPVAQERLENVFPVAQECLENVSPVAQERCLEIRGFQDFPKFLEILLKHAKTIVLIENSCIKLLSDLVADNLKNMKICWIERCNEMEYVTCSDKVEELADILTKNFEILWVSEAAKLKSICKGTPEGIGFKTLTSLYLEYCPELSNLCISSDQLSGLIILHVKYCQKLVKLFDDESAQLPKLESLHLWALPELKKISCGMQSLLTLTVAHCPFLEYIFDSGTSTNVKKLRHQVKFCDNMRTLVQVPQSSARESKRSLTNN